MFDDFLIWLDNNIRSNDPANVSAAKVRTAFQDVVNTTSNNIVMANTGGAIYTLPIEPGSPAITVENTIIPVLTPGTYTNFGGVVLPEGHFGLIFKNGETYAIENTELPVAPVNGVVEEGNPNAVSGGEVFSKTLVKAEVLNTEFNLLDGAALTTGKYINSSGAEITNASFSYYSINLGSTPFLFVDGNYSGVTAASMGAFFDSNGDFVRAAYISPKALLKTGSQKIMLIIPNGATKLKLSVLNSSLSTYKVTDGMYGYTENGIVKSLLENYVDRSNGVFVANVLEGHTQFLDFGYLRVQSGDLQILASTTIGSTGLIPVNENDTVHVRNWLDVYLPSQLNTRGQWFDVNGNLISAVPVINSYTPTYVAPAGAKYGSFVFELAAMGDLSVEVISAETKLKINAKSITGVIPVNYWEVFSFTWFGDSITQRNGWQPYVISALNITNFTNLGIGSTCMINAGPTPMCSDARIQAIKDSNPDVLTILAGANDLVYSEGGTSAITGAGIGDISEFAKPLGSKDKLKFYGAYSYVIESLLAWKPTLRIFIMGTTWAHNNGATFNTTLRYSDFALASKNTAEYYGLVYIDTFANIGFNKFTLGAAPYNIYSVDQIHPNDAGSKRQAEIVISAFNSIRPL